MSAHPPCGLYRTTQPLGELPAGRLVYFHNHGDPGAGIYLPRTWSMNRAQWHERGTPVPGPDWSATLQPLPAEGLYRVRERFSCCEKKCVTYEPGALVQLGYDGEAHPILFVPEWASSGLAFPERGTVVDGPRLSSLDPLLVSDAKLPSAPAGGLLH